jgi:hypothetical protein
MVGMAAQIDPRLGGSATGVQLGQTGPGRVELVLHGAELLPHVVVASAALFDLGREPGQALLVLAAFGQSPAGQGLVAGPQGGFGLGPPGLRAGGQVPVLDLGPLVDGGIAGHGLPGLLDRGLQLADARLQGLLGR